MRVLHLTDTHLGHRRTLIGAPRTWSRADDHHEAFVTALMPAMRGEVDLVIHSGDVFDRSRPPPRDVARALEVLSDVARRVPVFVIAGNHDRLGISRHATVAVPRLTLVDDPRRIEHGGAAFGFVPYAPTAEAFAAATARLGAVDLLVCHQAFDGVEVPRPGGRPFTFRVGRQRDTVGPEHLGPVGAVACGHIHPRQVVRYGAVPVVHPGSTERTAFVERDQTKGFALWHLGSRSTWRFVDLPSRPMRVVSSPDDLNVVRPGDQVVVRDRAWLGPALERGALVVPPRRERGPHEQLRLFADRRRSESPQTLA